MEARPDTVEPIELEELDIEEFAKDHPADRRKPCAHIYVIRIDRERRRVRKASMTGAEILSLVGKTPETHKLFQKFRGGKTEVVEARAVVSFAEPGVERFQTIPKDTTEGASRG